MLSVYRIGQRPTIWFVHTAKVADPNVPPLLPIGSTVMTIDEARALAEQILEAIGERVPS